jgi:tagatose 1,6-diphosphate aldolase
MALLLPTAWFTRPLWARKFSFIETGRLRDGELELIPPAGDWLEAALASAQHPRTQREAPDLAKITRAQLLDFLSACPNGRQTRHASMDGLPAYHWWMRDHQRPELPIAGGITLRIGHTEDLEFYYGHVGYHVYPAHRGRHFAERAVRLILPLAARHGINPLWITCNPDNWPSLRTCQRLGAALVQTVVVPAHHPLRLRGEVAKCRFRLDHVAHVDCGRTS